MAPPWEGGWWEGGQDTSRGDSSSAVPTRAVCAQRDFLNLGRERLFFSLYQPQCWRVSSLQAVGMGCRMFPGWGSPQPLLPLTAADLGDSGTVGGCSWHLEKVLGLWGAPWGSGKALGCRELCGVPPLSPGIPLLQGTGQIPFCTERPRNCPRGWQRWDSPVRWPLTSCGVQVSAQPAGNAGLGIILVCPVFQAEALGIRG